MNTAQSWLVYEMTGSPFWLGMVGFCTALPSLFLSPIGGALADRVERRKLLIIVECFIMTAVVLLATLAMTGLIQVWHIFVIASIIGTGMAIDMPTRQALVPDLVSRDDLTNAVALNSSVFHGTRIFGPAIAGVLVGPIGTGGCFYLTSISYIGIITALFLMKTPPREESHTPRTSVWASLADGFHYIRGSTLVLAAVSMAAVFSIFGTAQRSLMPIFAGEILNAGSTGFGLLMAASGAGALIATLAVASLGDFGYKGRLLFVGAFLNSTTLLLFATSTDFLLSLAAIFASTAGEAVYLAMSNSILLFSAPDHLRGRVMSAYMMTSAGLTPLAAMFGGTLSSLVNAPFAIGLGGTICTLSALTMAIRAPVLRRFP